MQLVLKDEYYIIIIMINSIDKGISSPLHLSACSLAFCGLVSYIVHHEGIGSGGGALALVHPRRLT
jgi:hypothetical protein